MHDSRTLDALVRELEQLQQQLPKHSISPSILARIDELEEEIAAQRAQDERRAVRTPDTNNPTRI